MGLAVAVCGVVYGRLFCGFCWFLFFLFGFLCVGSFFSWFVL